MNDKAFPYTYAAHYIRETYGPHTERVAGSGQGPAGFTKDQPILTLSQADKILHGICRDANLDVRKVAESLAEKFLAKD